MPPEPQGLIVGTPAADFVCFSLNRQTSAGGFAISMPIELKMLLRDILLRGVQASEQG